MTTIETLCGRDYRLQRRNSGHRATVHSGPAGVLRVTVLAWLQNRLRVAAILMVATTSLFACSASTQKPALAEAMESETLRRESFEAMLRVLDEHPEYVDELVLATLKHPRTLDRFVQNTSRELARDDFARRNARHLARHPRSLRMTQIAVLDAVADKPAAQDGIAQALNERPQIAAMVLAQREDTLRSNFRAVVKEAMKNSKARRALLKAMEENNRELSQMLIRNPEVLGALLQGLADAGLRKGATELETLLKAIETSDR
jgi:hypothetical protein